MIFKKNAAYDLIAATSMGVRITPFERQPVHLSQNYLMQATSAESNVLTVSAALGLKTKVLTAFVKDHAIAQFIKNELAKRHIAYEGPEFKQEGPWGVRHQFNIADSGFGLRAPRVTNDRSGEVGRLLDCKDFDLDRIFDQEGVKLLHISGLIAALSEQTSKFCLDLARKAKSSGTKISFDLNYRASFWKNREEELSKAFKEIASLSDILIGNEEDFQLSLGIKGPEAGGQAIGDEIESFKQMIETIKQTYPNAHTFANTLREVKSANEHLWGAIVLDQNDWTVIKPRPISVLDRIGGGDGFVGGLLYGFLKGWDATKAAQFGWATGALAASVLDDFARPLDEEEVFSIFAGNARVKR